MVIRTPFHPKTKQSKGTMEFEEHICVCVLGDSFPLTREGFAGKGPNSENYRK